MLIFCYILITLKGFYAKFSEVVNLDKYEEALHLWEASKYLNHSMARTPVSTDVIKEKIRHKISHIYVSDGFKSHDNHKKLGDKIATFMHRTECGKFFGTYLHLVKKEIYLWNSSQVITKRFNLENFEDRKENWESNYNMGEKDGLGYRKCYGHEKKTGVCKDYFNKPHCIDRNYSLNGDYFYYPACCNVKGKCQCLCIYWCHSKRVLEMNLDKYYINQLWTKCTKDVKSEEAGKAWQKKACEETKNGKKYNEVKEICSSNDLYCGKGGYCHDNVACKYCIKWTCKSQRANILKEMAETCKASIDRGKAMEADRKEKKEKLVDKEEEFQSTKIPVIEGNIMVDQGEKKRITKLLEENK